MTSREHLKSLHALEQQSPCKRAKVGAMLIDKLSGEYVLGACNGFKQMSCDPSIPGKCGCLHAEQRLLDSADHYGYTTPIYRMLISTSPCMACAERIINSKIILEVAYLNYYRKRLPITLLTSKDIMCVKVEE